MFCLIMNKPSSAEFAACAVATTQQRGNYRNTQSYFFFWLQVFSTIRQEGLEPISSAAGGGDVVR